MEGRDNQQERLLWWFVGFFDGEGWITMNIRKSKKQELILSEQQKREKVIIEAKEFRKDMGKMIKIKQELFAELEKAKKEERRKQEEQQKVKDREELDDIARMIKEAAKKEKKK